jgi:hypothetical protein
MGLSQWIAPFSFINTPISINKFITFYNILLDFKVKIQYIKFLPNPAAVDLIKLILLKADVQ